MKNGLRQELAKITKTQRNTNGLLQSGIFSGMENRLEARTTQSFYYVIKVRLSLKFVTETDTYTTK